MERKKRAKAEKARTKPAARVDEAIARGMSSAAGVANLFRATLGTALSAVQGVGGDLGTVAKHAVKGTVQAVEKLGGDLGSVAHSASRGAVKAGNEAGADVGVVAKKAVEGTIEAAREMGADVAALAKGATEGAIEAADRIGSVAGRTVRAALAGTIESTRVIYREAAPKTKKQARRPVSAKKRKKRKAG
jgi:hypothetical protein